MTKKELLSKIKGTYENDEQRNAIVCAIIGHSNILDSCFGYIYCTRCKAQIGDTLGGVYSNDKCVLIGHSCDTCKKNYKELTWKDKLYAYPNPLEKTR